MSHKDQPPVPEVKDNLQLYGLIQHINKGCNSIKCSARNHQPAKDDLLALITKLLVEAKISELKRLVNQDRYTNRDSYAQTRISELSNLNQEESK